MESHLALVSVSFPHEVLGPGSVMIARLVRPGRATQARTRLEQLCRQKGVRAARCAMNFMDEFNSLIAPGNTQPGGFYKERRPPTPQVHTPPTPRRQQPTPPPMGDATMKLFSSFVETSVARQEASPRPRQQRPSISLPPPPPPAAPHAHARAPTPAPLQWKVTEEMMNMKWGAVLRTLQPSTANSGPTAPHVTIRSAQHPTLLTPRPRQNLGYLSSRPALQ